jgi:phage tail sheath protein FI
VNTYGVATAINMDGWKLWGNYTGAYPSSTDAKDIWFPVRRMFNWHGNNFIRTYFSKVDDPTNRILIESVVDSENIRCAAYAPEYWAGARIEYLEDDNPITEILSGHVTFRQHIAPYTPAQWINNVLDYDLSTLQAALSA